MNPFPYTAPVVDTRLRSPADETVGDRGRTFKTARTEGGDGRPAARNQGAAGGASTLDRHSFDLANELVERNRATPVEHLARKLLGARTSSFRAPSAGRLSSAPLRVRLRLIDGLGRRR